MASLKKCRQIALYLIVCPLLLGNCSNKAQRTVSLVNSALQTPVTDTARINPGVGVGALRLGDTRERALELFPKKPNYDAEYNYDQRFGPCAFTEIHWLDSAHLGRWGAFIYIKEEHIFQIAIDTPRYSTPQGITSDSSPDDVRAHYSQLQAYALLHSGTKINGGRDLIYWVDRQKGIAFEFYYDRSVDARRVGRISVFEPGTAFQPQGCVSPPQEWRELEPFALELGSAVNPKAVRP
jgi:hypothetical protein